MSGNRTRQPSPTFKPLCRITGGNEASCRLHARLGFTEASHFHAVGRKSGRWIDVVDYEKMIESKETESI